MNFLLVVSILLSLALAAFCAGAETALLSVSPARILHLAREGGRKARIVERALSDLSRTTTMLLVGNNLASVGYSTASAALILSVFPGSAARTFAQFVAACLVLYCSEFLPKLFCAARPLRWTLRFAPTLAVVEALLRPLTACALKVTDVFLAGSGPRKYKPTSSDLLRILEDRKDGVRLSDFESALVSRLIVLRKKGRDITPEGILSVVRDLDRSAE